MHFFSCPCLVDQGSVALPTVPLKSLPPLSDISTAQYTCNLLAKIKGQRGIHQTELFKKRKRRRGSRYKRCSCEQIRWLSNIGRKDKQKAKEHNKANIRKYYESPEQNLVTLGIIGSGKGLSNRTKILKILELNFWQKPSDRLLTCHRAVCSLCGFFLHFNAGWLK